MLSSFLLCALTAVPASEPVLQLVETTPIETTLGSDEIPEAHEVWLEMIRGAKRQLHIAQFYVSDRAPSRLTPVLAEIEAAAKRGVAVRLLAESKFQKTYPDELKRLGEVGGIEVRLYDISEKTGGILHAKYFTVDSQSTFLGSQNLDWRALEHIQELGVRIESAELTAAFDRIFLCDWDIQDQPDDMAAHSPAVLVETEDLRIRPVFSPKELCVGGEEWDLPRILELIDGAEKSVRIQLLNYKAKNRDRSYFGDIENALRSAAARKVKVELLLADWSKARWTIEGLQSLQVLPGIDVKLVTLPEWSGGFIDFARVVHAKYMVADGKSAWIGTSNWSGEYFHASRNVGLIVEGASFAGQLDGFFERGWNSEYAELVDPCAKYEAPRRQ